MIVIRNSGPRSGCHRSADGNGRQVVFAGPVAAVFVAPAEVGSKERHDDPVTLSLNVVRANDVEAVIDRDIPGIAHAPRKNLQTGSQRITSQDATLPSPIVVRIVVGAAVCLGGELPGRWNVRGIFGMRDVPEFAKRFGGHATIFPRLVMPLRIPFRHVAPAIRPPHQSMQRMFVIAQVGVDDDVLIHDIVTIKVTNDGQLRRVRDVQITALPGQSLDAVESGCKHLPSIGHAIAISIGQDDDAIVVFDRFRKVILRALPHHRSAFGVETQRGRFVKQRFACEDRDFKAFRNARQLFVRRQLHFRFVRTTQTHTAGSHACQ